MSKSPEDDRTWQEIARDDPWLFETTAKSASTDFSALTEARFKPLPLLQPAFAAAQDLHKSVPQSVKPSSELHRQALKLQIQLGRESPQMIVSRGCVDRILRIMNLILHQCRLCGIHAAMDSKRYILVSKGEVKLRLSFNERFEEVYIAPVEGAMKGKRETGRQISQGTGELSIMIHGAGPARRLADKVDQSLEDQFGKILSKIALAIAETTAWQAFLASKMAESAANALAVANEVALKKAMVAEMEGLGAASIQRKADLVLEARAWDQAAAIRRYAAHVEQQSKGAAGSLDPNLPSWILWAQTMANDLDPTSRRLRGQESPAIDDLTG